MIKFSRDKTSIKCSVEIYIPELGVRRYDFSFDTNSDEHAGLAADAMQEQMENILYDIRKNAYASGYKDGRGHQKNEEWFPVSWEYRY